MNQEKIGKFISKQRKQKNMTQESLAEKMGVSINAVSKWERGLCLPDVSLFKKLCNELDISLEELINGEKGSSEKSKEKAILETLKETNETKRKMNKKIIIINIIFLIILSSLIYYHFKLKVNLETDSDYLYDIAINYLKEEELRTNPDRKYKDFNVFYSYYPFGIEKNGEYKYAYMWIYSTSYYLEEYDSLAISTAYSVPHKITFKNGKVIKVETPKEGNEYTNSIKKMFPGIISIQVLNFDKEKNINKLFNEVSEKKNIYYDYLTLDMNKIKLEDISYKDLLFSIEINNKKCIPVQLNIFKNNKYKLYTHYQACKPNQLCNSILIYTKKEEGTYNYDVLEIIRHSKDADLMQFTNDNLPKYEIYGGNSHLFVTDDDNKYLLDFLKSINVDLNKCAQADYVN